MKYLFLGRGSGTFWKWCIATICKSYPNIEGHEEEYVRIIVGVDYGVMMHFCCNSPMLSSSPMLSTLYRKIKISDKIYDDNQIFNMDRAADERVL